MEAPGTDDLSCSEPTPASRRAQRLHRKNARRIEETILGLPCYPSIGDIEKPVDLALIATAAGTLP